MKKFRTIYYETGERKERPPLVFAHLSDLHGCFYGEDQEGLLDALKTIHPDAVMVTGDMIVTKKSINQKTLAFFGKLAEEVPVFFCNGNHETRFRETEAFSAVYRKFCQGMKEGGVTLVTNRSVRWEKKGRRLMVAGYEAGLAYYGRFSRKVPPTQELTERLGKRADGCETVLLAHNPMFFGAYKEWGADLTFSGHLHGGYVRLPGIGGVISPQMQLFPKYDRGIFCEDGKYLCVSAGLGDHSVSPRFFNPTELPVVIWH